MNKEIKENEIHLLDKILHLAACKKGTFNQSDVAKELKDEKMGFKDHLRLIQKLSNYIPTSGGTSFGPGKFLMEFASIDIENLIEAGGFLNLFKQQTKRNLENEKANDRKKENEELSNRWLR